MHIKLFTKITAAACLAAILISVCGCFFKTDNPPLPSGDGEALTTQEVTEAPVPTATQDFGDPVENPLSGAAIYDFTEDAPDNSGLYAADASLAALGDILGEMPVLTVKVEDCDIPYCEGACVYTSMEDFGSLGFIAAAAHAAGEYPDWVYRGAAQIAANGSERVLLKLGAALNNEESIDALALQPTRFAPRFNNDDALKLSYRTAGAYLQFIIEKHGGIKLDSLAEDKPEFIRLIGLEGKYEGRCEGLLDNCEVSFNLTVSDRYADNVLFPMVIDSATYTLYAQPLTDCKNAHQLEALLYKLEVGKQMMREFVEAHADRYLNVCSFGSRVNYYMLNEYGNSFAQGDNVVLKLEARAILHETVHQWIMPAYYDHWYFEGLADFLALQGGEGESLEFVNSMARLAFMHPDVYGGGGVADYNGTPASARVPGDEFTYDQSNSLIAYICETYTLDPILAVAGGSESDFTRNFERAFGKSFDEVVAEWREWLGA